MSIPPAKALTLFQQTVNTKVEPVIQYGWVHKLNSKGKFDERFFTATNAGVYLCTAYILNIMKVSRLYAWIDLVSIEVHQTLNKAEFNFHVEQNPHVEIHYNEIGEFFRPIFNYLIEFLPNHHPAFSKLPQFFERRTLNSKNHIISMYLSACHSLSIEPENNVIYSLQDYISSKKPLIIEKKAFSSSSLKAILTALKYSKNIQDLTIIGDGFPQLWSTLATILSRSSQFYHITISNYSNYESFDQFCDAIKSCTMQSIEFEKVKFTEKMAEMLSNTIQESLIGDLVFNNCDFNTVLSSTLFMESSSYTGIKLFAVTNDKSVGLDDVFVPKYLNFFIHANITQLELSYCNVEISKALTIIFSTKLPLSLLNLTGNFCSEDLPGNLPFSETLYTFDLKHVDWKGKSLATFLLSTPFCTAVELNLSSAKLETEDWEDLLTSLAEAPQNAMIVKLEWNKNSISNNFLKYILKLPCLRDLSLCHCHKINSQLDLSILSSIIANLPLEKLSIRRTFKSEHGLLRELRGSLFATKTLQNLDVSESSLGDVGLAILQDIVSNNQSLTTINFDKSEITDVSILIDLFNTLAAIPKIVKVTKPRHDIQVLSSEHSRRTAQEIRSAWNRLNDAVKRRARNGEDESTEIEGESSIAVSGTASTQSPSKPKAKTVNITSVNWNIEGEPQIPTMASEWEEMRAQFSYANLTGLPVITSSDNLNFSL